MLTFWNQVFKIWKISWGSEMSWGPNESGPKRVGAQTCRGPNVSGPKWVGAQMSQGPNESGPKWVGAQMCWGPNESGPKCAGAQMSWGPNVLGPKWVRGPNEWGPNESGAQMRNGPKCVSAVVDTFRHCKLIIRNDNLFKLGVHVKQICVNQVQVYSARAESLYRIDVDQFLVHCNKWVVFPLLYQMRN